MIGVFPLVHNGSLSFITKFVLCSEGAGPLGNLRMGWSKAQVVSWRVSAPSAYIRDYQMELQKELLITL